jgi:hypothetical protein
MLSDRTDPFHRHCRMQVIVVHASVICQGLSANKKIPAGAA